jgi:hypothetical protein
LLGLFLFYLFVINQFKDLIKVNIFGPFPNKSQTVLDI